MMSADMGLAIDTVRIVMNLEQMRAKVAAHNIAMANVPGSQAMRLDASGALATLRASRGSPELFAQTLQSMKLQDLDAYLQTQPTTTPLALDGEVAEMSAASGRYQALADGVSRQFALMQLAIRGGR
jgi:flagellar basal-body rod protein FlgB